MTIHVPGRAVSGRIAIIFSLIFMLSAYGAMLSTARAQADEEIVTFEIRGFEVKGNTVLKEQAVYDALKGFTGKGKLSTDVEEARDVLESFYHDMGYPTVLVNIPEQTVDDGLVTMQVIESRIRWVKVTGNRYFTKEKIMAALPSFRSGTILYVPHVKEDLARLNTNPDFKVTPVLKPARELGFIDVELKVEDRLPLHASLETNNRSTHTTSDLRLNAMVRYENLWQKEHALSVQYQTAPEEPEEVQVLAVSYVLPSPWVSSHLIALFGVASDSETAFGEGFQVTGEGELLGARYVIPLDSRGNYYHTFTLGLDYKDFDETLGFAEGDEEPLKTPVTYLPLSLAYRGSHAGETGMTRLNTSLNMAFRGIVTDQAEFEIKRRRARGNYLYVTLGLERLQDLLWGFELLGKVDGQIASEPLISNEQYSAGGIESVRGYKESEVTGDHAFHGTVELAAPNLWDVFGLNGNVEIIPYGFYDYAWLMSQDVLEGQDKYTDIDGAGMGVRGKLTQYITFRVDWATALTDTDNIQQGDTEVHFQVMVKR
ncbi:MAG: ShlB/FhaC/HecB family hemolysin secretion/activation protein [Thermodesulfobacteriota bacterium]|nr:ShlB/FhaC/HecB family hemolysin secretion/activation protein [Thermodesulfobacteriota bacterium]